MQIACNFSFSNWKRDSNGSLWETEFLSALEYIPNDFLAAENEFEWRLSRKCNDCQSIDMKLSHQSCWNDENSSHCLPLALIAIMNSETAFWSRFK